MDHLTSLILLQLLSGSLGGVEPLGAAVPFAGDLFRGTVFASTASFALPGPLEPGEGWAGVRGAGVREGVRDWDGLGPHSTEDLGDSFRGVNLQYL
ncbi:hypothetical protein E2C01_025003 [Portunus trituberculatus]|uniref:Uncharacterized protein n=1 Tax=Portunus trituberculatus TaxID=210409 RepID=A0A5B7EED7_PORTR|nr:hypothetical protein [Portunus trituberculatus]